MRHVIGAPSSRRSRGRRCRESPTARCRHEEAQHRAEQDRPDPGRPHARTPRLWNRVSKICSASDQLLVRDAFVLGRVLVFM